MRQTRLGVTRVDGAQRLWFRRDGKWVASGWLMPQIDQATLEASPGIQSWSHPRGKVSTELFDGGASILSFSDYCARHLIPTYPLTT